MSEWWTYTLSDFLLFSPQTYGRLLERYNASVWPAPLVAFLAGTAILALLRRPTTGRSRAVAALLATGWVWVAVAFLLERYATINWAAVYFAGAFALEAVLLLGLGVLAGTPLFEAGPDAAGRAGAGLYLAALVGLPLASAAAHGLSRAEVFGVLPDPTAVGTLGLLVAARGRGRVLLMAVPALWCATTGLTLLAMKDPLFWVAPLAAAAALAVAVAARRRRPLSGELASTVRA